MQISDFIKKLEEEFEEVTPGTLKAETSFRDMPEWSSMYALIIIALIDTEYGVSLNGEDLRSSHTVQDLFDIVTKRQIA